MDRPVAAGRSAPSLLPGTAVPPLDPLRKEGMAMTIVGAPRAVTGGVDTHLDVHVAAALDAIGGVLGVESFSTTPKGYRSLVSWLASFGTVAKVGVEGTGSYGAGLACFLRRSGIEVVEVSRPNREERRRQGKSDPVDAIEAARSAISGRRVRQRRVATGRWRPFVSSW